MNEDIREGSGGVSDVRRARKGLEQLPDLAIDRLGIVFWIEFVVGVLLVARVDGCLVSLVVDDEKGGRPGVTPALHNLGHPAIEEFLRILAFFLTTSRTGRSCTPIPRLSCTARRKSPLGACVVTLSA